MTTVEAGNPPVGQTDKSPSPPEPQGQGQGCGQTGWGGFLGRLDWCLPWGKVGTGDRSVGMALSGSIASLEKRSSGSLAPPPLCIL